MHVKDGDMGVSVNQKIQANVERLVIMRGAWNYSGWNKKRLGLMYNSFFLFDREYENDKINRFKKLSWERLVL